MSMNKGEQKQNKWLCFHFHITPNGPKWPSPGWCPSFLICASWNIFNFSKIIFFSKNRLGYKFNGSSFIKFRVKLHLVEFFEVEWHSVVHCSFFGVRFGHRLKNQPIFIYFKKKSVNQYNCCPHQKGKIHLKKEKSKKLKEKTSVPFLFFLQTLFSLQWLLGIASSTMIWKMLRMSWNLKWAFSAHLFFTEHKKVIILK